MIDDRTIRIISAVLLALGPVTWALLSVVRAPYGRHARPGWGPEIPARLAWILMELPAVVVFGGLVITGGGIAEPVPAALIGLWLVHYVHRTFIFPFRIRATGKRMPLVIAGLAFTYQVANSAVNGGWLAKPGRYNDAWLTDPRMLIGCAIFAVGLAINLHADTTLIRLRAAGGGYHIPQGGLYRWISCPNYLGEILEWIGFAVACASLPALAFAIYTICNLAPRALQHHAWYQARFPDYPSERRALVPGLL